MSSQPHSAVLFTDNDGLPLEFNIKYSKEKSTLKNLIEEGGGICTDRDKAVQLITRGTKVFNSRPGQRLVSSQYIFDCVRRNSLQDVTEYAYTVDELDISDISEDDSEQQAPPFFNMPPGSFDVKSSSRQSGQQTEQDDASPGIFSSSDPSQAKHLKVTAEVHQQPSPSSSRFLGCASTSKTERVVTTHAPSRPKPSLGCAVKPSLGCAVKCPGQSEAGPSRDVLFSPPRCSTQKVGADAFMDIPDDVDDLTGVLMMLGNREARTAEWNEERRNRSSITDAVPSSSQPDPASEQSGLDAFDNFLLKKAQQKPQAAEDLSDSIQQVTSSDDIIPRNSELSAAAANAGSSADSYSREQYLSSLEAEVEAILAKQSPMSLEEKTTLIKYICVTKNLSPGDAMLSLHLL